jgi:hypothetical protein
MINVVCFCGCSFSLAGDTGACPQCGEPITLGGVSTTEVPQTREESGPLNRSARDRRDDELAA